MSEKSFPTCAARGPQNGVVGRREHVRRSKRPRVKPRLSISPPPGRPACRHCWRCLFSSIISDRRKIAHPRKRSHNYFKKSFVARIRLKKRSLTQHTSRCTHLPRTDFSPPHATFQSGSGLASGLLLSRRRLYQLARTAARYEGCLRGQQFLPGQEASYYGETGLPDHEYGLRRASSVSLASTEELV